MTRNKLDLTAERALLFLAFPLALRCESTVQLQRLPHSDSFCLILPPNLKSAIAAVTYMAEQLKKQDTDDSVRVRRQRCTHVQARALTHHFLSYRPPPNPQR